MMRKQTKKRGPGRPSKPITRDHLLAVARKRYAAAGYAATSMRDLAEELGITKASLFHHFPSKEALYMGALTSILTDLKALIVGAGAIQGSFEERLDRLAELATHYVGDHPEASRLLTREILGGGPFMANGGYEIVQVTLAGVTAFLEAGMKAGDIPRQDPRQLALSVAGLHLYLFAAPDISSQFLGQDIFTDAHIEARIIALKLHLRRLCGLEDRA